MRVEFVSRDNGPERLVCEAEVVFDDPGPFWNTKLVGFALWYDQMGDLYVTLPARAFGIGPERKYFDYLRSVDGEGSNIKNVKSWIIAEYRRRGCQPRVAVPIDPNGSSNRRGPGERSS